MRKKVVDRLPFYIVPINIQFIITPQLQSSHRRSWRRRTTGCLRYRWQAPAWCCNPYGMLTTDVRSAWYTSPRMDFKNPAFPTPTTDYQRVVGFFLHRFLHRKRVFLHRKLHRGFKKPISTGIKSKQKESQLKVKLSINQSQPQVQIRLKVLN